MSHSEIERLVEERRLLREPFEDAQVVGFWEKAAAAYADSQTNGISTDGAYQLAYTAALQATLAILAAYGLRVRGTSNHYLAFHALQRLDAGVRNHGLKFDGLRLTRHQSIYEPDHDEEEMTRRLGRAVQVLRDGLPAIRSAILAARPSLEGSLRSIEG